MVRRRQDEGWSWGSSGLGRQVAQLLGQRDGAGTTAADAAQGGLVEVDTGVEAGDAAARQQGRVCAQGAAALG